MMLILLGMVDIFAGILLLFHGSVPLLAYVLGIVLLLKGIFSVSGAASSGYFLDWMGWVDIAAGVCLILGISISFLWFVVMLKGIFSVISGVCN